MVASGPQYTLPWIDWLKHTHIDLCIVVAIITVVSHSNDACYSLSPHKG